MAILARKTYVKDGQLVVEELIDDGKIMVNKKEKLNGGDFVFIFQKAIFKVLMEANLSRNALKILLYLIAKTEFEKEINTTAYAISKELKLDQATTSKAMNELENISIVVRDKVLKKIRLNYEIAFKGSPKNYNKLQFRDPILLETKKSNQIDLVEQLKELEKE
jgi:predicted transcriptional regulator